MFNCFFFIGYTTEFRNFYSCVHRFIVLDITGWRNFIVKREKKTQLRLILINYPQTKLYIQTQVNKKILFLGLYFNTKFNYYFPLCTTF